MNLVRAVFVLVALAAAAGQYVQELRRLAVVKKLPAAEARRYYEVTRRRTERVLTVSTVLLAVAAVSVLVWSFLERR